MTRIRSLWYRGSSVAGTAYPRTLVPRVRRGGTAGTRGTVPTAVQAVPNKITRGHSDIGPVRIVCRSKPDAQDSDNVVNTFGHETDWLPFCFAKDTCALTPAAQTVGGLPYTGGVGIVRTSA